MSSSEVTAASREVDGEHYTETKQLRMVRMYQSTLQYEAARETSSRRDLQTCPRD